MTSTSEVKNSVTEEVPKEAEKEIEKLIIQRGKTGKAKWVIFALAVFLAILELYYQLGFNMAIFDILSRYGIYCPWLLEPSIFFQTYPAKAIILSITVFAAFLLYPVTRKRLSDKIPWYDWILAAIVMIGPLYIVYLYTIYHSVETCLEQVTPLTVVMIFLIIFGIAEATRRAIGPVLPIVMLAFIAYGFYYAYVNKPMGVTGIQWMRGLFNLFIGQNTGFLGIPLHVMITYVFAFLFFSSILRNLGVGEYITSLILSLIGKKPGGPAKVAVVSSGLMGMISGSSVANVLTTGTFSIPAMKKAGFPPEIAGAVEPVASTGGQLMPPIMGAAAFIMAEFLGRPYRDIMIAAALPAILYYYGVYVFIDKECKRLGLRGLEKVPPLKPLLKKIYFIAPIPIIIFALLKIEPQHAVMTALSSAIIVAWVADDNIKPLHKALFSGILIAMALFVNLVCGLKLATALFFVGISSILIAIVIGFIYREAREVARAIVVSIDSALRDSVPVFLAAASASVVQAMISFTGLHKTLGDLLLTASMGQLYLLLLMTSIFSLILGMGVPTTANYIITATILAPTLVKFIHTTLGYAIETAKLASHMFVFYYGILADLTPPVALAAYAGAILARAHFWKTAINASKYGLAMYMLPYIFVVSPCLLITAIPEWTTTTLLTLVKTIAITVVVIHAVASGITGWLMGPIREKWIRVLLTIFGVCSVSLNEIIVLITAILLVIVTVKQYMYYKKIGISITRK